MDRLNFWFVIIRIKELTRDSTNNSSWKMKNHLLSNALIPYRRQVKIKKILLSQKFGTFSPYEYLSKRRVVAYFCISPATIGGKLLPPLVPVILISRPGNDSNDNEAERRISLCNNISPGDGILMEGDGAFFIYNRDLVRFITAALGSLIPAISAR